MQIRLELHRVQMPPHPLGRAVIYPASFAALRTNPRVLIIFYEDIQS